MRASGVAPASARTRATVGLEPEASPLARPMSRCSVEMYSSSSSLATVEAASRAARRAREGWGWVIEEPEEAGSWVRMRRAEAPTA